MERRRRMRLGGTRLRDALPAASLGRQAPRNGEVMRRIQRSTAAWLTALLASWAMADGSFQTPDPLKAFVYGEYPPGSDYFIDGNSDTILLRCLLPTPDYAFEGVALSERSIWGNRGGDWEIFRKTTGGTFAYVGTKRIANTSCLESCRSSEYVSTGRCTWKRGWPR